MTPAPSTPGDDSERCRIGSAVEQDVLTGDVRGMDCAARVASGFPVCLEAAAKPPRKRWVSKLPGRRLLMVMFLSSMLRAPPATKAVRPARAALDRSNPAKGILTLMEVMFTILPNPRFAMASMTF